MTPSSSRRTMNVSIGGDSRPGTCYYGTCSRGRPSLPLHPELRALAAEPELEQAHNAWRDGRAAFLLAKYLAGPALLSDGSLPWQGEYFHGTAPDGTAAPEHQTKLHLRGFEAIESDPAALPAEEAEEEEAEE